jgi:hypothetical protein
MTRAVSTSGEKEMSDEKHFTPGQLAEMSEHFIKLLNSPEGQAAVARCARDYLQHAIAYAPFRSEIKESLSALVAAGSCPVCFEPNAVIAGASPYVVTHNEREQPGVVCLASLMELKDALAEARKRALSRGGGSQEADPG